MRGGKKSFYFSLSLQFSFSYPCCSVSTLSPASRSWMLSWIDLIEKKRNSFRRQREREEFFSPLRTLRGPTAKERKKLP